MKKMNDENDFKMKLMKKVSLFPKIYWLKKYNDGIKMMEKVSRLPSKKQSGGRRKKTG
jgi:hypothetical protein